MVHSTAGKRRVPKKTSIKIDPELWAKLKVLCVRRKATVSGMMAQLITSAVKQANI